MIEASHTLTIDGVTWALSCRASARDFERLVVGNDCDATGRLAADLPELIGVALCPALSVARDRLRRSLLESWGALLAEEIAARREPPVVASKEGSIP